MPRNKSIIASLDIGTSTTKVIVGEQDRDGNVNIIGIGQSKSLGLRKGSIVDLDGTVKSIIEAVEQAERMIGVEIDSVFVGISSAHIQMLKNRGVVAVSGEDKEISEYDYDRVLQAAKVVAIPPEREIIDSIPINFIVDGYDGIKDPVGMIGVRLEVEALILTATTTAMRNLRKCVERAGLAVENFVLSSLATGEVALTPDEKELGAVLVNIGGGTTEVAIFQNSNLMDKIVIPVGGDHITSDISKGLRIPLAEGEKIKLKFGTTLFDENDRGFEITTVGKETVTVSTNKLTGIIEPRVQEIFYLIKKELSKLGYDEIMPGGIVLTGGVASLPGIAELAQSQLGGNVRIYQPQFIGVADPAFTTGTGIIQYVVSNSILPSTPQKSNSVSQGFFDKIKVLFNEFFR
ncbi:cell division protein FtsA [Alkalicella caledoniensis]|uniref:Cell division protein FtsA n=1 Tax=Alkalicella caledoniensis TaxID=2731377 RepID=A0A7G9WC99_ALKCA|nr:cell division protein FtsA [Alkalicella caledoniensis]QNO16311.1 cell division protein FtsA [Alkalicella caledoniensis]